MPNAVITPTNYAGNGTQAGFLNAISTAMLSAGFNLLDSYTLSGNENRVWNYQDTTNGNATFDNLILEAGFTAAASIRVRGFSGFDTATDTGANVSSAAPAASITLSNTFTLYSVNHPEVRGVFIFSGIFPIFSVFYIRPDPALTIGGQQPNAWWNRNSAPLAFIPRVATWGEFGAASNLLQTISALRPGSVASSGGITSITHTTGASGNLGTRFTYPATIITNANEAGLILSSDCLLAPANGMFFGDTINNQYTFIESATGTSARLFIKTA